MKSITILTIAMCIQFYGYAQKQLSLEQSKSLALQNNSSVKNAQLELNGAREVKMEARTNYYPKVSATAMGMQAVDPILKMKMNGGNLPVYDGNPASLGSATQFAYMPDVNIGLFNQMALGYVNVVQPVYAGGKIKAGNQLSVINMEVKEKLQKLSKNEIILHTEQQYWQVITIQEKQKTLDNYIDFLDTLYTQVENALKNGFIIKNDLLKVSIKKKELQVNKMQLDNGRKLALMQLCQTIGIEFDTELLLTDRLVQHDAPERFMVSSAQVLTQRPEYKLLEDAVTATKLETTLTRGDYLPSVGVGITGYYLDQLTKNQRGSLNGLVYASVSIPVSDWWGGKHKLNEKKTREKIAENNLENNKGLLQLQMEKAWMDLKEADRKIQLIQETFVQTEENLKVSNDSYRNGLIQLSDLLEARALKSDTENKLTEANCIYNVAVTNYLQLTGR